MYAVFSSPDSTMSLVLAPQLSDDEAIEGGLIKSTIVREIPPTTYAVAPSFESVKSVPPLLRISLK